MFPLSLLSQSAACEGSVCVAVWSSTLLNLAATYSVGSSFRHTQSFEQWTVSPPAHCDKHLQTFARQIVMLASHSREGISRFMAPEGGTV